MSERVCYLNSLVGSRVEVLVRGDQSSHPVVLSR